MIANAYITVPANCGDVRGYADENGIETYLGIPYATAERFCPPKACSWSGLRECMEYGSKSMQPNFLGEQPAGTELEILGEENCLNLNLWVQPGTVCRMLPVVVYIHGGGFQVGSNSEKGRDGASFIQNSPIVFVSVNYRLGALGFLQLGEEMGPKYRYSGNCGVLDVLEALRWVNRNIEAFGGDPKKVTLMGISAGAKLIGSLLTIPETKELCHGIILESGAMQSFRDEGTARSVAKDLEAILAEENADFREKDLLTMPAEKILRAQAKLCDAPGTTCYFGPVMDELVFHKDWHELWKKGEGWKGRAILGSCQREMARTAERADFAERKDEILHNLFGDNAHVAEEHFRELEESCSRGTANWVRVLSDMMYRYYTDSLAKHLATHGSRVWVYSYTYGEALHGDGFHALMQKVSELQVANLPQTANCQKLSQTMRDMVRRFLCAGETESPQTWMNFRASSGYVKMVFDANPHLESKPKDTLTDFPAEVFHREQVQKGMEK